MLRRSMSAQGFPPPGSICARDLSCEHGGMGSAGPSGSDWSHSGEHSVSGSNHPFVSGQTLQQEKPEWLRGTLWCTSKASNHQKLTFVPPSDRDARMVPKSSGSVATDETVGSRLEGARLTEEHPREARRAEKPT